MAWSSAQLAASAGDLKFGILMLRMSLAKWSPFSRRAMAFVWKPLRGQFNSFLKLQIVVVAVKIKEISSYDVRT